ncbi:BtaA family protein [soil metagenome]
MHTEFENVDLNLIRYSLVWEDANTLFNGLEIGNKDCLLMITSAGCNVLNALLKKPAAITAIDLNPEQNRLLLFKKHLIGNYDHEIFLALLGFYGKKAVQEAWEKVENSLEPVLREHAAYFFQKNPDGIMPSGKLETYIHGFFPGLPEEFQQKIKQLITFETLREQQDFFQKELDNTAFENIFIDYFDQQNLSKGRDPKLFTHVKETGGEIFYSRLKSFMGKQLVKDNFYFRFFMFGPRDLPEEILPPCYRKENFLILKEQLHKLKIVTGEAIEYLLSKEGENINKAGLSNIFEYVAEEQFAEVCNNLLNVRENPLRFIYWNLLQSQGDSHCKAHLMEKLSEDLTANEGCFYFNNVRVMETVQERILTNKNGQL